MLEYTINLKAVDENGWVLKDFEFNLFQASVLK